MEVYRRSSGLVLLLGLFLLATTLQGVQGEVESEGPSESECRPYIEKALKELEAGEAAAGSSAEDGDGDSKEDIPTVEITDDSAHQEGDGEKDDTNEEGQDSNENVQTVSEKIEPEVRPTVIQKISSFFQKVFQRTPSKKEEAANESKQSEDKQDDASQEQQDEASVNDADRKDAEEDDEQKEDSKEDDTKPDEAVSAEDDGKDDASNEGDVEKADDKVREDEESNEQQTDDNVSENEESKEQQAESEEEKADADDSKEEVEAQQNADDSTEDDGAQQDESKEEQAQEDDKSEEHGDSLEERIEAEIIEHLTQSQAQIQDDESKEDEPAAQVEDQKESIEDQAQSDENQAQSEEEQPKSTEDMQDTKDDDSKEDDGKDGDSKEDEKSDTEDDKEASKEVTKDETDDDSKEDEHERHKRSIDDAQDDGIESKEEEAVLKEDASKEDDTNSREDEAATKEEVDDKQEEADLKEETAESKENDENSKEGTTENADKSDEKEEPQSDEKTEDDKPDSAENKEDGQKDGDSKEDDAKSTEQDDKDDKEDDVKRDSTEENADDKSAEVEKDSKEKDGGDSNENEATDDNKSGEDGAPVEELSFDTEIPSELRPRDHVEQLLKLDEQSSDTETVINRVSEITLRDLKKLYENAIKPLEVLYKYRDLSNRHFGDSEIFSKPLILFMGPWSGGKSSIINYLTNNEYNDTSLRTGAEPSPAYFNILMYGEEPEVIDGTELAADFTFSGLQKFGQGLEERLRGVKLPSKLLEKVNIVEIPGILEVRKQVSRVFPFNDACQWFIDRGDIIFLVYDPSKLDVGPETEAILDQLKGREHQTRIILNKADRVKPEELLRVQGALIWNISPLMSSPQPPIMYTTSLWSRPYEPWAPVRLLQAQERAFLRDLRGAVDKRIENKIASARRFAVRVRNHAKMVDCYLTTYYNHKSVFGNRKQVADAIIEHPQDYHIYEGLSTLTNISRYDLPDPDVYKDFFKLNPLYEFQQLSATCTYFRGCPINRLDIAIAYDLPELLGTHRKRVESALTEGQSGSQQQTSTPGS
ncbi:uncharacterized protein [Diabrotica undecimpunctata]|uniref:uncharacterized protein isoform X1 n=1 Tax=Diabrotica undecimpunctata TaxID=50387 RepID=UPI003B63FD11